MISIPLKAVTRLTILRRLNIFLVMSSQAFTWKEKVLKEVLADHKIHILVCVNTLQIFTLTSLIPIKSLAQQ
jgi:uncharacterized membrane protein